MDSIHFNVILIESKESEERKMWPQKKSNRRVDVRKLMVRIVALLCALVIIASAFLAALG